MWREIRLSSTFQKVPFKFSSLLLAGLTLTATLTFSISLTHKSWIWLGITIFDNGYGLYERGFIWIISKRCALNLVFSFTEIPLFLSSIYKLNLMGWWFWPLGHQVLGMAQWINIQSPMNITRFAHQMSSSLFLSF